MALLQVSDFVGEFQLPKDQFNVTILQNIINENESAYIRKIFGAVLGNEIIAYINSAYTPTNTLLDKVINPFQEDFCFNNENLVLDSKGLKYALLGLIYYDKQKDSFISTTAVNGAVRMKAENNTTDALPQAQLVEKYNKSVDTIGDIQIYILKNHSDYDTYNGVAFAFNYII